jgi:hypothetical protein
MQVPKLHGAARAQGIMQPKCPLGREEKRKQSRVSASSRSNHLFYECLVLWSSPIKPQPRSLSDRLHVCNKKKSDLYRVPTQRTCNLLRLDVGASHQLRIEAQKGNGSQATHRHVSEGKQSGLLVRIFAAPSRERRAQDNAGRRCNRSKGGTAASGRWHAGWGRHAS